MKRKRMYKLVVLTRCRQRAENHISLALSFRLFALQGLRPSIVDADGNAPGSLRGMRGESGVECVWCPHPYNPNQPEPLWASQVRELIKEQT